MTIQGLSCTIIGMALGQRSTGNCNLYQAHRYALRQALEHAQAAFKETANALDKGRDLVSDRIPDNNLCIDRARS